MNYELDRQAVDKTVHQDTTGHHFDNLVINTWTPVLLPKRESVVGTSTVPTQPYACNIRPRAAWPVVAPCLPILSFTTTYH